MAQQDRTTHPLLSCTDGYADAWRDVLLLAGRILLAWVFLASGFGKLGNIAGTTTYFTNMGMSPAAFFAWFAAIFEFVVGILLILGVATRYAALATFIWVLIATAIAHRYWAYSAPQQGAQYIQFLKNISIMGGALYVFVAGAGRYAVDAVLARR